MRGRRYPDDVRAHALVLRGQGRSLREISEALGISKITVQGWVAHVQLTAAQRRRLLARSEVQAARGRALAVLAWQRKIETWKAAIRGRISQIASLPLSNPNIARLACGLLYICEGSKYPTSRHLAFGNTDPRMIKLFLTLLRRYFSVDERKFRVCVLRRWDQDPLELEKSWSQVTGIPLRQFYPSRADRRTRGKPTRRKDYWGVCHLMYFDTTLQYELQAIGEGVLALAQNQAGELQAIASGAGLLGELESPPYLAPRYSAFPEREELPSGLRSAPVR